MYYSILLNGGKLLGACSITTNPNQALILFYDTHMQRSTLNMRLTTLNHLLLLLHAGSLIRQRQGISLLLRATG